MSYFSFNKISLLTVLVQAFLHIFYNYFWLILAPFGSDCENFDFLYCSAGHTIRFRGMESIPAKITSRRSAALRRSEDGPRYGAVPLAGRSRTCLVPLGGIGLAEEKTDLSRQSRSEDGPVTAKQKRRRIAALSPWLAIPQIEISDTSKPFFNQTTRNLTSSTPGQD